MIRAILAGACGRMGQAVRTLASETEDIAIAACIDPALGTAFATCQTPADVVIDFSTPDALGDTLAFCVRHGLPLVLATTGHQDDAGPRIDEAAEHIAILKSANLSYGAYVLARLAAQAKALLGSAYDITILESHHRAKKDAPSGTAKLLADAMDAPKIPMLSIRGGGTVGTHEIAFYGDRDILQIKHEALDRRLFAKGALDAAQWITTCAPGLYGMADLVAAQSAT